MFDRSEIAQHEDQCIVARSISYHPHANKKIKVGDESYVTSQALDRIDGICTQVISQGGDDNGGDNGNASGDADADGGDGD